MFGKSVVMWFGSKEGRVCIGGWFGGVLYIIEVTPAREPLQYNLQGKNIESKTQLKKIQQRPGELRNKSPGLFLSKLGCLKTGTSHSNLNGPNRAQLPHTKPLLWLGLGNGAWFSLKGCPLSLWVLDVPRYLH
jgi:hypothetical protein